MEEGGESDELNVKLVFVAVIRVAETVEFVFIIEVESMLMPLIVSAVEKVLVLVTLDAEDLKVIDCVDKSEVILEIKVLEDGVDVLETLVDVFVALVGDVLVVDVFSDVVTVEVLVSEVGVYVVLAVSTVIVLVSNVVEFEVDSIDEVVDTVKRVFGIAATDEFKLDWNDDELNVDVPDDGVSVLKLFEFDV